MKLMVSVIIILINSFIFSSCGPEAYEVKIVLVDENPDPSANYYIVGNNEKLGNWKPDEIKLEGLGKERSISFAFVKGTELQFKFTKGSWNTEALGHNKERLANHSLTGNSDTTITYNISFWMDKDFILEM